MMTCAALSKMSKEDVWPESISWFQKKFIGVHKLTYKPILNKKGYYYLMELIEGMGGMNGFDKENATDKRDGAMGGSGMGGMNGFDKENATEKRDG